MKSVCKLALLTVLLIAVCLTSISCGKYVSSYTAIGLIRSNTLDGANVAFLSLDGVLVFRLQAGQRSEIYYEATLEQGCVTVGVDTGEGEVELFCVEGENKISEADISAVADARAVVYVIIRAQGAKNGRIAVTLKEVS